MWEQQSQILAQLIYLVGKWGLIKASHIKGTKKEPWHMYDIHQEAFDTNMMLIEYDVMLVYPNFKKTFDIYLDSSTQQFGAIITKLESMQCSMEL